jgi:GNAT superfamily N-acetyltransferase
MSFQELTLNRRHISSKTTQHHLGTSLNKVIRLVDEHTRSVQSWLSTRAPQAKRFEGVGVTATSSGLQVPLLNLALGCDFSPGTSDEVIDHEIELVKRFFAKRAVPWSWWIGPHVRPPDIGQRLEQHGLKPNDRLLPALVASLPTQLPAVNPAARVWQASNLMDLEAASTIRRIAFNFPYATALHYFETMADDWLNDPHARLFLAGLGDGAPGAIGAMIVRAGMPGVYVMATLPEWSRRGLGSAILARILSEAAAAGHRFISLTASKYGYPLYRRFGFEHIFDYTVYRLPTLQEK